MLCNYVNLSLLKNISETLFNSCVLAILLKSILKGAGGGRNLMGGTLKIN